jgi:hypothetical protein
MGSKVASKCDLYRYKKVAKAELVTVQQQQSVAGPGLGSITPGSAGATATKWRAAADKATDGRLGAKLSKLAMGRVVCSFE